MLLIVDLIFLISLSGRGWYNSPSFSGYKNNIVIKESGAHSCWINGSASIKETCILWVPGYINTGWRRKTVGRKRTETKKKDELLGTRWILKCEN
jgi:hypothetical protein